MLVFIIVIFTYLELTVTLPGSSSLKFTCLSLAPTSTPQLHAAPAVDSVMMCENNATAEANASKVSSRPSAEEKHDV